jgi:hypothetical protein
MPKAKNNPITIHGLIIPIEWDEKGNVIAISVSTFAEEEYLIEKDEIGKRLISFLRQEIEISGLYRLKEGRKIIRVKGYNVKRLSNNF